MDILGSDEAWHFLKYATLAVFAVLICVDVMILFQLFKQSLPWAIAWGLLFGVMGIFTAWFAGWAFAWFWVWI